MSTHFADIVETVKTLSFQEKQELHELIEKYLIEERKLEIYENSLESQAKLSRNELVFSSGMVALRAML